jgi:eukaryotic-like serine/threonine-protein kinase
MIRIIREEEPSKPSTRLSTAESLPSLAALRQTEPKKLMALLRGDLDWITMKALEKDRTRRYETANGLARDIQRYLADEVIEARPPSTGYRLKKFVRRHKGQVIAASLVLVALLAGMAGTTWGLVEANRARLAERDRADGERDAKLDADQKRRDAETNLGYAKKGNEILGSVFQKLNPKQDYSTVAELREALKANLTQAVRDLEGTAIGDPLAVAEMQNTLGLSLLGMGAAEQAIALFAKSRETRKARLGPEHPETLNSMNNLAEAYQGAGKLDLALPLKEETLKLTKARLGPEHPQTLASMNNLASAYQDAGKHNLAVPLMEETLKLSKAKLGPDHVNTLSSMNNLAGAYQAAGKRDLVLPLLEETLKLRKAMLGPEHPDTLTSMNSLAGALVAVGKIDLALPLYEETVKLRKAKLGPEHPNTLNSMNSLAGALKAAGKVDLALPLYEETVKLRKAKLGPEHPDTLHSMNDLAVAYWSMKQLDKSIPLFEETLELKEAKFGREHLGTLRAVANLGVNYKDAGRLKEAIPLLEEVHQAAKNHPELRFVDWHLLDGYAMAGENAKLANLLSEARKELPKESSQLAGLLDQVGLRLLEQKKWIEAEPLLRECLAIRERTQPDAWTTFNTMSMLGGALLGQKKHADAEPLLLKGYEGMKKQEAKMPPTAKVRLPEAIERLVQLYEARGQKDEAAKWRKELEGTKAAQMPESKP